MKPGFDIPCETRTLPNGLTVVVAPQPGFPVVTVDVTYDVGSRVEPEGKTGFAHLFEHLMFEGRRTSAKGEHFRLVAEAGGTMNGTTSEDRTNYFETLPSECLDLALFLEADRMRALVLTAGEARQPARGGEGGKAAPRRQPALRPLVRDGRRAGVRRLRVPAPRHRVDGRPRPRDRSTTRKTSTAGTTRRGTPSSASSATSTPKTPSPASPARLRRRPGARERPRRSASRSRSRAASGARGSTTRTPPSPPSTSTSRAPRGASPTPSPSSTPRRSSAAARARRSGGAS